MSWNSSIIMKSKASRSCFLSASCSFKTSKASSLVSLKVSSPLALFSALTLSVKLSSRGCRPSKNLRSAKKEIIPTNSFARPAASLFLPKRTLLTKLLVSSSPILLLMSKFRSAFFAVRHSLEFASSKSFWLSKKTSSSFTKFFTKSRASLAASESQASKAAFILSCQSGYRLGRSSGKTSLSCSIVSSIFKRGLSKSHFFLANFFCLSRLSAKTEHFRSLLIELASEAFWLAASAKSAAQSSSLAGSEIHWTAGLFLFSITKSKAKPFVLRLSAPGAKSGLMP